MRSISILVAGAALASCTGVPPQPLRSAQDQAHYLRLVEGKVAGRPQDCLSTFPTSDMTVIDESTIVYRRSGSQVYVGHMRDQCSNLGSPGYAMLTKQYGSAQMCRGDIVQVVDTSSGMLAGSCVLGGFTPFTRPR